MKKTCPNCKNIVTNRNSTYCSNDCFNTFTKASRVQDWLNGIWDGSTKSGSLSSSVKNHLIQQANGACPKCGWDRKNPETGRTPLEVNHIDGNWRNNLPENLETLCPNCHSITSNYKALNIGQGRTWRKRYNQFERVKPSDRLQTPKEISKCKCGNAKEHKAVLCSVCRFRDNREKADARFLSYEEMKQLVENSSYEQVGRKFGVVGATIKKFLERNRPEGEAPLPSRQQPAVKCACGKKLKSQASNQCQECYIRDRREEADAQFPSYVEVVIMLSSSSQQSVSNTIGVPVHVLRRFLERHAPLKG